MPARESKLSPQSVARATATGGPGWLSADMRTLLFSPDATCARIAAQQLGLISRIQALQCGLSAQAIRRRVNAGRWVQVLPGVYRLPGATLGWQQDVMAAVLWAGSGALASHRCAAALRGWDGISERIVEITTPRRLSSRPGIVIHERGPAQPQDADRLGPIPATGAARTLLDLGSMIPIDDLELVLEDALRRGHASLARLRWQIRAQGGKGTRGTASLRKLLEERPPGYRVTKSGLEIKVRRVLRTGRLPEPITHI